MRSETWSLSLRDQVRQNARKMCWKPLSQIKQIIWAKLPSHILRGGAEYSSSNHHMAVLWLKIPNSHITQDLEIEQVLSFYCLLHKYLILPSLPESPAQGGPGCRIVSTKTGRVPGKLGRVGNPCSEQGCLTLCILSSCSNRPLF